MPIYAYRCEQCGHSFDRLQKLSDPDPDACPSCSAASVKRTLTAPSFRLAGGGWYETDFKKDGDRKRNLADGGEGGSKEPKADSKGESKGDSGGSSTDTAKPAKPAATPAAAPASKPADA